MARGPAFIGIVGLTVMVYAHSLSGRYVYEDIRWDGTPVYLSTPSLGQYGLTNLSHWLTVRVFGPEPLPARAISLAWHLVNGWLVWLVARHILSAAAALVSAGLFLLLPIQTEAVAAAAYRSELIATTCVLLALLTVRRGWWPVACVLAIAAIGAKQAAVMAIALVPLWAWWHRWDTAEQRVYWLAAAFPVLLLVLDRSRHLLVGGPEYVARELTAAGWLMTKIVVPVGLTIDHDWAAMPAWLAWAGAGVLMATLVLAWRWWPMGAFAVLFTLVALLPRFVWQLGEGIHERHLYVPVVTWSLALASLLLGPKEIA